MKETKTKRRFRRQFNCLMIRRQGLKRGNKSGDGIERRLFGEYAVIFDE